MPVFGPAEEAPKPKVEVKPEAKPAAAAAAKPAPELKKFNANGQRIDLKTGKVYPAVDDPVNNPAKPYPYAFTFMLVWGYNRIDEYKYLLNPLQFATEDTRKRLKKMLWQLCPNSVIVESQSDMVVNSPYTSSAPQLELRLDNLDPINCGGLASQVMFNNWEYFKIMLKQIMEPQGVYVNTNVPVSVLD